MAENAAIARPYAQAIFELANDAGQLVAWSDALHAAGSVVSDEQVVGLIGAPGTDSNQLIQMIVDIAGKAGSGADTAKLTNLVRLLAENRRLHALPDIASSYDALKAEVENRVEVSWRVRQCRHPSYGYDPRNSSGIRLRRRSRCVRSFAPAGKHTRV